MKMRKGIGVLLNEIYGSGGERSANALKNSKEKMIKTVILDKEANYGDGELVIEFNDGFELAIKDEGRSCCEHRYITTDDDLPAFVGATFLDAYVREVEDIKYNEYGENIETSFVIVKTSLGEFTIETHNEHNGYYGGFFLVAEERKQEKK